MNRWFKTASTLMAAAVLLGAFGAHALKARLSPEALAIYHTGVLYHFIHALGIFAVSYAYDYPKSRKNRANLAGILTTAGIVFFSGSLYLLAVTGIHAFGMITPIGGLLFIAGWIALIVS
jgi:uncharacterized membrane protein YgdD (TMEM256/DUF423 family)